MKKLLLFLTLIIAARYSNAQQIKSGTPIPAYRILNSDSAYITPANLKKNEKTLLIYFSPDCPHCQHLTMELKEKMKQLTDVQIVMVTWSNNYDIRAIKNFVHDYGLKKYPNVAVGTEGYTYFLQKYFKVATTPYIAVYNSEQKLVKGFEKAPDIDTLMNAIKVADKKRS